MERKDQLEQELRELFSAKPSASFQEKWQSAIEREEFTQMKQSNEEKKVRARVWAKRLMPLAAALVLVCGAVWAGSQSPEAVPTVPRSKQTTISSRSAPSGAAVNDMAFMAENMEMTADSADAATGGGNAVSPAAEDSRKLIRTADLTLRTANYDQDLQTIQELVANLGGYVEDSYQNGDAQSGDTRSCRLSLRVPSGKLDAFLTGAAGVGRVVNRSESTTDMTVQYADNAARLATLRTKLARLDELLGKAENVEALIEIESAIADTQYQIDSYESTQRSIDRRADMSQVSLSLTEDSPVAVNSEMTMGERLGAAFQKSLEGLGRFFKNMLVFVVMAAPALAVIAVVVLVVCLIRRGRKGRKAGNAGDQTKEDV